MNQQVKEKWIKALRSGEYKQCKKGLRVEDGYCCLGVLTDLYEKENNRGKWIRVKTDLPDQFVFDVGNGYNYSFLPGTVCDWAGISRIDSSVDIGDGTDDLITLNDALGKSFNEIADIIEKHL